MSVGHIITINGNIGSGKSEVCSKLSDKLGKIYPNKRIIVLQEPVEKWKKTWSNTHKDNVNMLEAFYKKEIPAAMFQMFIIASQASQFIEILQKDYDIVICERDIDTTTNVFGYLLRDEFSPTEDVCYSEVDALAYNLVRQIKDKYTASTILLDTDPAECAKRIMRRGRAEENKVSLEYLKELDHRHKMLYGRAAVLNSKKAIIVSGNNSREEVVRDMLAGIQKHVGNDC